MIQAMNMNQYIIFAALCCIQGYFSHFIILLFIFRLQEDSVGQPLAHLYSSLILEALRKKELSLTYLLRLHGFVTGVSCCLLCLSVHAQDGIRYRLFVCVYNANLGSRLRLIAEICNTSRSQYEWSCD